MDWDLPGRLGDSGNTWGPLVFLSVFATVTKRHVQCPRPVVIVSSANAVETG